MQDVIIVELQMWIKEKAICKC